MLLSSRKYLSKSHSLLQQAPEEIKETPVESKEEETPTQPTGEAPRFITELTTITTPHGKPVQFIAIVTGYPTPKVRWILDGEYISEESTTYITEYRQDGTCTLSIKETFQEDEGEYTVEATNDFGIVRSTAELILEGKISTNCFTFPVLYLNINR